MLPPGSKIARRRWPWVAGAGLLIVIVIAAIGGAVGGDDAADESRNESESRSEADTSSTTASRRPATTTTTVPAATLLAEYNASVARSCLAVGGGGIAESFDPRWARIGATATGYEAGVDECVAKAEEAKAANAGPVNVDEVVKNPDAVEGQYFVMIVDITQFDGATGPCAFRAAWDNVAHEYSFDYAGDNAIFTSGDGVSSCPALAGVDQNDVVRVWVKATGTFSYDTQIGGSTTVPSFSVLRTELLRKA